MTIAGEEAPRRVLPEGRFAGPMPWVIAVMILLSVLSATAALALVKATGSLQDAVAGRVTIQIVEANPDLRAQLRDKIEAQLRSSKNVTDVEVIGDEAVRNLLAPWLASDELTAREIPVPALIDATLIDGSGSALARLRQQVAHVTSAGRVDPHADWLGPLAGLLDTLKWLALLLVALTAGATAAAVMLGSRAALDQHRATIAVMHLIGATDLQIARLFERRVAQDAVSGAALGSVVAIGILIIVGWRINAVGAALVAGSALGWADALIVLSVPVAGVALAVLSARAAVLRALAKVL